VRILLATDAASERHDLPTTLHRLVNYDIPFNPNKLEQRIGRIDRYAKPNPRTSATCWHVGKAQLALRGGPGVLGTGGKRSPTWRLISDR